MHNGSKLRTAFRWLYGDTCQCCPLVVHTDLAPQTLRLHNTVPQTCFVWQYATELSQVKRHRCMKSGSWKTGLCQCHRLPSAKSRQTFPELCRIVVLVLQTLSLLTMSLVTSTSASTKLLCFRVMSSSRSVLMVERFLAMILALMAAIFSTDMASDRDLTKTRRSFGWVETSAKECAGYWTPNNTFRVQKHLYLIWSVCTMPSLWPSKRAARRSLSRRTRSSSLKWWQCGNC